MSKGRHRDPAQGDLFGGTGQFFPVRTPKDLPRSLDMKREFAVIMGEAIRRSGKTAAEVAAEMTRILGDDVVTTAQLNAYTAESRTSHTISIVRWIAFVRATGSNWPWDFILKNEGLIVLEGAEARLAEVTLLELRAKALLDQAKAVRAAAPVTLQFRSQRPSR